MTYITPTLLRPVPRRMPMIVAVFSYRHDAALVPALIANITPMVHGFVSYDDRRAEAGLSDEPGRRNQLHSAARSMGADWILAVDPDERFEANLAQRIGDLTAEKEGRILWVFNRRELVSATTYRTDGIWGNKTEMRLYPASATLTPLSQTLHGSWVNPDPAYRQTRTGLNLYHLRHATPERTRLRRDTYAAADPERRFQYFGYDYLIDMRGAQLTEVRPERGFEPPHIEDGGLWASPDIGVIGDPSPDPIAARLNLMSVLSRQRGADGAAYVAEDIWGADPDDTDMQMVAASLALRAGRARDALRLAFAGPDTDVPGIAHVIGARAHAALSDKAEALAALAHAVGVIGPSPILAHIHHDITPDRQDFAAADAQWRRWTKDRGRCHEGPGNGTGKLTVIIIGFNAPATLARAVLSIRSQSPEVEIVVVNSGGGDARGVLQAHLDHIRLIETETPLFVGAARNIGIECSRARYVAFLAGDCVALPGWVEGRLARHESGAMMVSTAVQPSRPGTIIGTTVEHLIFPRRAPTLSEEEVIHYGRSYCRTVFAQAGLFAPLLRVGEDTEFNRRTDMLVEPVWAPEIKVAHDDPQSLLRLLMDLRRRGQLAAFQLRSASGPVSGSGSGWVKKHMKSRRGQIRLFLRRDTGSGLIRRLQLGIVRHLGLMAFEQGLRRADSSLSKADIAAAAARACASDDIDTAIRLAIEAVSLVPQNPALHQLVAEFLLKRAAPEDISTALGHLHKILALSPTAAHALWLAASALRNQGQTATALALCEDAVIAAPGISAVVLVAARVAHWAGKPKLALCLAQQALGCDPAFVPAHQFAEQQHRMAGRLTLAEKRKEMAKCLVDAKAVRSKIS